MNTQIIMLPNPIVVGDNFINDNDLVYVFASNSIRVVGENDTTNTSKYIRIGNSAVFRDSCKKIIAGIESLPKLDLSAIAEKIGWVDLDKLALQKYNPPKNKDGEDITKLVGHSNPYGFNKFLKAFKKGFKAAQSLNEKKFSEIDVWRILTLYELKQIELIKNGEKIVDNGKLIADIIESVSKPKVYNVIAEHDKKNNLLNVTKIIM